MKATITFFCLIFGGIISTSTWVKADDAIVDRNLDILQTQKEEKEEEEEINAKIQCPPGFQPVGDHCLLVDNIMSGTWQEMKDICLYLDGFLPSLKDANLLADINDYLQEHGLNDVSYWVGSTDESSEGEWYWIKDQSRVHMGTPLWGDLADMIQQPSGGLLENCGVLLQEDYYYMHDEACTKSYSLLCEKIGQVTEIEDIDRNATSTKISKNTVDSYIHAECPFPYEMFLDKCLFINTLTNDTWANHKTICEGLGGHLVKLDDANLLGAIFDHMEEEGIETYFWIGASDEHQEGHWVWHDSTAVRMSTPFWGDFGDGAQEPTGGTDQNCGHLHCNDHYFFHDVGCTANLNAICQMDISK